MALRSIPPPRPSSTIPTRTARPKATTGVPRKSRTDLGSASESGAITSANALPSMRTTGRRIAARVAANEGRCCFSSSPRSSPVTKRSGTFTSTHRAAYLLKTGPARTTVGIATRTPSASVRPRFAFNAETATSGPGCGGTNPCMAERPARVGIAMRIRDNPDRRATRMMTGINRTRPISKNIGRPMTAPTRAMVHGSALVLERPTSVSTIRSAPPESARSLPNIAPKPIRIPTLPMVDPKPVANAATDSAEPRPAARPTPTAPMDSARKGCRSSQVISAMMTATPATAAMINRASLPAGTTSAASNAVVFIGTPSPMSD